MFFLSVTLLCVLFTPLTVSLSLNNTDEYLPEIAKHSFVNLNRADFIRIDNCSVESIEEEAFKNVTAVSVEIVNNAIKNLTDGIFVELFVDDLIIDNNEIEFIEPGTFNDVRPLWRGYVRMLSLQKNSIEKVVSGVFNGTFFHILLLDENKISAILPGSFDDMKHLQTLSISGNCLKKIGRGVLEDMPKLFVLNIADNNITEIDEFAFRGNKDMFLNLQNNVVSKSLYRWYFEEALVTFWE